MRVVGWHEHVCTRNIPGQPTNQPSLTHCVCVLVGWLTRDIAGAHMLVPSHECECVCVCVCVSE